MTEDEVKTYGTNRAPKGLKKIELLGKGGCAIVWLCVDKNGRKYAAKQFPKTQRNETNYNSGVNELKLA